MRMRNYNLPYLNIHYFQYTNYVNFPLRALVAYINTDRNVRTSKHHNVMSIQFCTHLSQ